MRRRVQDLNLRARRHEISTLEVTFASTDQFKSHSLTTLTTRQPIMLKFGLSVNINLHTISIDTTHFVQFAFDARDVA